MAKKERKYTGFTIIEVVLVLAIAGLIFAMVIIALPALQRAQRNTQRKQDLSRMQAAITQWYSHNPGTYMTDGSVSNPGSKDGMAYGSNGFCTFYNRYLSDLKDPSTGEPYKVILWYVEYAIDCTTGQAYPRTTGYDGEGVGARFAKMEEPGDIQYNNNAICDGEISHDNTGHYGYEENHGKTYTIRMMLEGGAIACVDAGG